MCCQRSICIRIYIYLLMFLQYCPALYLFIAFVEMLQIEYSRSFTEHAPFFGVPPTTCVFFVRTCWEDFLLYKQSTQGEILGSAARLPLMFRSILLGKSRCFSTDCCHHKTFQKKLFVHPDGSPNKSEKTRMEGGKTNAEKVQSSQFVFFIYPKKQWTQIGDQSFLHSHRLP